MAPKIKILYGLEAAGGGSLKHLVYLATRLNKDMFDITVILSNSRQECISSEIAKMESEGTTVLFLPMQRNISPINDMRLIIKLIFLIKKGRYDIVHAHSSKAGGIFRIAAWICRFPLVYYTPHCFYFQGKKGIQKKSYVLIERILGKLTTAIIVSESEKKQLIDNRVAPISKIVNINNAIDFNEYQQEKEFEKIKKHLKIPANTFIVGAIGRLVPQKDWETYIYAANLVLKNYPQTKFLIVGEGELFNELNKLIFKLNLENSIILTGQVKEIYKIYAVIDVFVNTSLWEGLPYVFLEAMKYRRPIIATNTGNDKIVIHEETGFITPAKDYRFIASKIVSFIENKQLSIKMGEKGMEWLTLKYSFELFIRKHEQLYQEPHYPEII